MINEPRKFAEFSQVRLGWVPRPRYNIAPGQMIRALLDAQPEDASDVRWGLIPAWARDRRIANHTVNARSETVASKPAFRSAWKSRRCLIPADGYYEWTTEGRAKIPWQFTLGGGDFAMAGLWESWRDPAAAPEAQPLLTATILTCEPNPMVARWHDRMPVILPQESWAEWLDPKTPEPRRGELMRPYPPEEMEVSRVSTRVNSVRNDDPAILHPEQGDLFQP